MPPSICAFNGVRIDHPAAINGGYDLVNVKRPVLL